MKTKITVLVFSFIFITMLNISNAQSIWTTQYLSNIGGNYLRKVQFVDNLTGWACGGNGTLIKTTNAGATWSVINAGTSQFLTAIYFLDANTGWVGAEDSYIRKTTDGGISWNAVPVQVQSGWWSAYFTFVNAQTGYVSCITKISKTTNGGLSWNVINSSTSPNFNAMQFFNETTGYVMSDGSLFKSVNGGVNWTPILTNTNINEYLFFLNEQTGWIIGANNVRKTTNGCDTWTNKTIPIQHPYTIKFYNENIGWCAGDNNGNGVICRTLDGGETWTVQKIEPANSYYDISFTNLNTGWASGNSIISNTQNGVTSVSSLSAQVPEKFQLKQNYPNPFNPATIINFDINASSFVSLKIYDMNGREIKSLVNENLSAGSYGVNFNAAELNSGIYFYTLNTGNFRETKKMMLVK
ncbi:MAG: T9SS type A sorting domain-containing protein [Ignavibacteria bacterium]|nr:T9SS type A sorting domain-containing protein [Ignavibacteria bacterium]